MHLDFRGQIYQKQAISLNLTEELIHLIAKALSQKPESLFICLGSAINLFQ